MSSACHGSPFSTSVSDSRRRPEPRSLLVRPSSMSSTGSPAAATSRSPIGCTKEQVSMKWMTCPTESTRCVTSTSLCLGV
eukprot:7938796-Alexandrium_andersonii.AAC.1